jgi:cobalt-precorrin-5B (C1)-methyltransferase
MEETREERAERIKSGKLREGWTTGTCASCSAKAATYILLGKNLEEVKKVEVELPVKDRTACLEIFRAEKLNGEAIASTIKDAGDDPDVTHGAEIGAIVRFSREKGVKIIGGEGIGRVTKPGLSIEVGEPDITPVPRKMIKKAVISAALELGFKEDEITLEVEIFAPEGRERAKKTMLERLGVIGGIGILGTLGIVVPYSTGAWKASIARQISVAKESGCDIIVCTTGRQSEELAKKFFPYLPDVAFVDVGDFIGFTLKYAKQKNISRVIIAGFLAKISKVAKGEEFTHAKKSSVDIDFLVSLAREEASDEICNELRRANTARQFAELAKSYGLKNVFQKVAELAKKKCNDFGIHTEVVIFDFSGDNILAYAS